MNEFDTSKYKKVLILQSNKSPYFSIDAMKNSDLVLYKSGKAYIVYKDVYNSFSSKIVRMPYNLIAKALLGDRNIFMEKDDGSKNERE